MDILNKAKLLPIGYGYDLRTKDRNPLSILIHTTNGAKGSSYLSERNYIYMSDKITAHYLIGKEGQQTQFLDPYIYRAWHAGAVNNALFNNNNSIGIENHYTLGEQWTLLMHNSLTVLVKELCVRYSITSSDKIERHRTVAIPKGRKIDPSGFLDEEFIAWRESLFSVEKPISIIYKVISDTVNIRSSPHIAKDNIVGSLSKGDIFESIATKIDENGTYIHGINTWAHLTKGVHNDKAVDGLGFVHISNLTIIN